jgi:kumamolisin
MQMRLGILLFSLISATVGAVCICQTRAAQSVEDGFKHFENSIVKLPAGAQSNVVALSNDARQRTLQLHFALEPKNMEELEARVARGETVSQDEMKNKYSGSEKDFKTLVSWLKDQGFQVTQTSADFTNVYAKATVAQIEKSLGVTMATVTYKGKTTPAATTAPKLPRDIGDRVIAIDGLQPFIQAIKHIVPREKHIGKSEAQENRPVPRPAAVTQATLKPRDILKA